MGGSLPRGCAVPFGDALTLGNRSTLLRGGRASECAAGRVGGNGVCGSGTGFGPERPTEVAGRSVSPAGRGRRVRTPLDIVTTVSGSRTVMKRLSTQ